MLYWNADWNQVQLNNFQLMMNAIFANKEVLKEYRIYPKHREFTEEVSRIADRIVDDMEMNMLERDDATHSSGNI